MYNYFMLIGYVAKNIEIQERKGKRVVSLRLAVKRDFANSDGEYDCDFVSVTLWDFLAENAAELLKKGSRVAVKGRICPNKYTANDVTVYTNDLYADRLIFLGEAGASKEIPSDPAPKE